MVNTGECVRAQILVSGRVQGVGYRSFACRRAVSRGLTGGVENLDSGHVALEVEGPKEALDDFIQDLKQGPINARVTQLQIEWGAAAGRHHEFTIR